MLLKINNKLGLALIIGNALLILGASCIPADAIDSMKLMDMDKATVEQPLPIEHEECGDYDGDGECDPKPGD